MKLYSCVVLGFFGMLAAACSDDDAVLPIGGAGNGGEAGSMSRGGSSGRTGSNESGNAGVGEAGQSGAGDAGGQGGAAFVSSCDANPCVHGTCMDTAPGSTEFGCSCDSGFAGKLCDEVAVDACTDHPCKNGGACGLTASGAAT